MRYFLKTVMTGCLAIAAIGCVTDRADAALLGLRMRVTTNEGSAVISDGGAGDTSADPGVIRYETDTLSINIIVNSGSNESGQGLPYPSLLLDVNTFPMTVPSFFKVELAMDDYAPAPAGFVNLSVSNPSLANVPVTVTGYVDSTNSGGFSTGTAYPTGVTIGNTDTNVFAPHLALPTYSLGLTAQVNFVATGTVGRFQADIRLQDHPEGGPLVPEPASIAAWAGMSVLGLVFGSRFRKKAA